MLSQHNSFEDEYWSEKTQGHFSDFKFLVTRIETTLGGSTGALDERIYLEGTASDELIAYQSAPPTALNAKIQIEKISDSLIKTKAKKTLPIVSDEAELKGTLSITQVTYSFTRNATFDIYAYRTLCVLISLSGGHFDVFKSMLSESKKTTISLPLPFVEFGSSYYRTLPEIFERQHFQFNQYFRNAFMLHTLNRE